MKTLINKMKILHLEDLPSDVKLVERELQKSNINFEKIVVGNRVDFESALKEFEPDIILSDHTLPAFNSIDALKIVNDLGTHIPFILVTATVSESFAVDMMKSGAYDYILKDRLQRLPGAISNAMTKKKAENDRQEYLSKVIANEAIMNEAESLAHFGSLQVDLHNNESHWSEEAYRILGYQPGEIQLTLETFLSYVHPGDLPFVKQALDNIIKTLPSIKLSYRIKDKTGRGKFIRSELIVERDHNQVPIRLTGFIIDTTEMQNLENAKIEAEVKLELAYENIRSMNTDLARKVTEKTLVLQDALFKLENSKVELQGALNKEKDLNDMKSRFVSMASHEFRTPLTTVLSSASLLSKYKLTEDQDKREKHIHRIRESVKDLNELLEAFLNLGKLAEGKVKVRVLEFNVRALIEDVFEDIKPLTKPEPELKLIYQAESSFTTDKILFKNILINLLSNAVKFSDKNKPIFISVSYDSPNLLIQIKDQGVGIAEEDIQYLFTTFYRGKNASNIQGTGLGLHIVKKYVDMLKGNITVFSELNIGTTFNISLPNLNE